MVLNHNNNGSNASPRPKKTLSYSQVAQVSQSFHKDQAIILDSVMDTNAECHAAAMGDIVGNKNVTGFSKISGSRVIIFLKSKDIVDKFVEEHKTVKINNCFVNVRPFATRLKRVIISNVNLIVPNSLIIEELEKLGIHSNPVISYLQVGS